MTIAAELAGLVLAHPYLGLGVAVLLEGPTATILAGTLVASGAVAWWPVLVLAVLADCLADSFWFAVGRAGTPVPGSLRARVLARFGLTGNRWESLQRRSRDRLPWLVGGAKLADVAAVPTFAALGAAGVPYRRFIGWISATTSVKSAALLALGWALAQGLLPAGTTPGRALLLGVAVSVALALVLAVGRPVVSRLRPGRGCARSHPFE